MIDFKYLRLGIWALARAHQVNTMAGHLGAAVVAGYLIGEQNPQLDERVHRGIEGELDRIIAGQSVFSPKPNAAISVAEMFAAFPDQEADEKRIDELADALSKNIDQTRQSGHNVIFATMSIRALKDHPELATPDIVDGIRKLVLGFNSASPGSGNYGKEKGRIDGRKVPLVDGDAKPPYSDLDGMAEVVLTEVIETASKAREGFGGLWHLVNHAAALIDLSRHGYPDLAEKGIAAHVQHLRLLRTLPDLTDDVGPERAVQFDPRTVAYWESGDLRRDRALLTHRVKTLFGFDTLLELIDDPALQRSGNLSFRYMM